MIGLTMTRSKIAEVRCTDDICNHYAIPVPSILCCHRTPDARQYLICYFNDEDGKDGYSGRKFHALKAPDGTGAWVCTSSNPCEREETCVSVWDLLSLGLLAVGLNGRAIINLLEGPIHETIAEELHEIWNHSNGSTPSIEDIDFHVFLTEQKPALRTIWDQRKSKQLPQVGPVRISKLMARKLPHLVPIYDSLVARAFEEAGSTNNWNRDHWKKTVDLFESDPFVDHLKELSGTESVPDGTSLLRVMDVVVWMHQRAKNRKKKEAEAA